MLTIKNNLNSPQTIHTSAGPSILPPMGELTCEGFSPAYAALYRSTPFITVTEGEPVFIKEVAQVNPPQAADDIEDLQKQYEELLGKKPHHKMKAESLKKAIDKALSE